TDDNGCTAFVSILLVDPTGITATITGKTNVSCNGGTNGTATVTGSGGTAPYTYLWSNAQTTATATGLSAGIYTVTVTDDNGCSALAFVEITEPTLLIAEIIASTEVSCYEGSDGTATVNATGGTTPYTYEWDTDPIQYAATASGLEAGMYTVTVIDANGCEAEAIVFIYEGTVLEINPISDIGPVCINSLIPNILLSAVPANPSVVYNWVVDGDNVGLINGSSTGLNPHIPAFLTSSFAGFAEVTVTATLNECIVTEVFTISVIESATADAGSDFSICAGDTYILSGNVENHSGFLWTSSGTGTFDDATSLTATYTPSVGDIYAVQVTLTLTAFGQENCDNASDEMVLSIFPPPAANAGPDAFICEGEQFQVSGASASHYSSISWSHNGLGEIIDENTLNPIYVPGTAETGIVTLTLTAAGYGTCEAFSDELLLNIVPAPLANAGSDNDLCGESFILLTGNFVANASVQWTQVSGPNMAFIFNSNTNNALAFGVVPGEYVFEYTVTLGSCSNSDQVTITNWQSLVCCIYAGPDITACDTESIFMDAIMPIVGTGMWSQHSGPGLANIVDPFNPQTEVNELVPGSYIFRWANFNGPACDTICDYMQVIVSGSAIADAGPDASICVGEVYELIDATAGNYTSLQWSTSGTGLFSDANILNPIYYPTASDILNGFAVLTLTAHSSPPCPTVSSSMYLTINQLAEILAVDDTGIPVNGYEGGISVINVLTNDLINGHIPDISEVIIHLIEPASHPGIVLDISSGQVTVAAGTPAGIYTLIYSICEALCPANCSDAIVTVEVLAPEILAIDDDYTQNPVNGYEGNPNVGNALDNDLLNDQPVDISEITIEVLIPAANPGVILDITTGIVSVAPGTPAGTYTITYQICEILNPWNCDDAVITVLVIAPEILAIDDDYTPNPVNGYEGNPNVGNALDNDLLNGQPVDISEITIEVLIPAANPGVILDITTGIVSVAPGTPAGTYTITYQICEILNPWNCDDAVITVLVIAPEILAIDDDYTPNPVNGYEGNPNVGNALDNDLLNGQPVDISEITIEVLIPATNPGVALDITTGIVSVAPGTPAGTYTINYQICEILNPWNCDDAIITVLVIAPPIEANNISFGPVNGCVGNVNTGNVLVNDLLNDNPVSISEITISVLIPPSHPGIALDLATGIVSIAPETPAGVYTLTYQICEILNPDNCDDAVVEISIFELIMECPDDLVVCEDELPVILSGATPEGGIYSGDHVAFNPNSEEYEFSAPSCGIYTITYTFTDDDGCTRSCEFTITVFEIPKPVIVGPSEVFSCTETDYSIDEQSVCNDHSIISYNWVLTGGVFVPDGLTTATGTQVTVQWDNSLVPGSLSVQASIFDVIECIGNDEMTPIVKLSPEFAGQVKYWNQFETYMPTPFPTVDYATYPHDYFYVILCLDSGQGVIELDTVIVQPRLLEGIIDLMSYFEFDMNYFVQEYGCEGYFLKIWDGGLVHYDMPGGSGLNPPLAARQLGNNFTYNNWGGVNATDALAIQLMATQININAAPYYFNWVGSMAWAPRFGYYSHSAADVNSSNPYMNGGITALDALTTNYRAVGLIDAFPNNQSGIQYSPNFRVTGRLVPELPYTTWPEPFNYEFAAGNPVAPTAGNPHDVPFFHSNTSYLYFTPATDHKYSSTAIALTDRNFINIYYLALGDINSSLVPTSAGFKAETNLALVFDGERAVNKGEIVNIPVRVTRDTELGAVTLGLNYRIDLIEVLGVDQEVFMIDSEKGIVRIAWADYNPVYVSSDEAIVNIRVRILDDIDSETRYFELDGISELADGEAQVIKNIGLATDALNTSTSNSKLFITNYPNPFKETTMISYSLPESGTVKLVVYNSMGQIVETLVSQRQEAGTYLVEFSNPTIKPGAYLYRIFLQGEKSDHMQSNTMIHMP
ncbi:MAG: T9SS type A sorting domain-containing protein, partial [Bacteroidales bacterium]|nr:T9SS type A sorting domain-containing protein [Bacteroidales bacterium]